jgi:hypothetical protein
MKFGTGSSASGGGEQISHSGSQDGAKHHIINKQEFRR